MSLSKFNKSLFTFKADENFEYKTLEQLYKENGPDKVYNLKAIYINTKGKYGSRPVAVTDFCYVNLPGHLLETVEQMREDDEVIEMINNGKAGFKIYEYTQSKYNKVCYSVEWRDAE